MLTDMMMPAHARDYTLTPTRATITAAFVTAPETVASVYGPDRVRLISEQTHLLPGIVCADCVDANLPALADTEVFFSGWGMPRLRPDQLDKLPALRAVFYAAGSCQSFAPPLLERGIVVSSAWRANAVPVAEFALAQILLSCKGYWRNVEEYKTTAEYEQGAFRGPGCYGETVALLGVGAIGRALLELLRPFHLRVVVFDPFLSADEAAHLEVEKTTLTEAFTQGFVVSNHLADNAQTAGLIDGALLRRLRPGATFINTGRGRTVREADLIDTLRARRDVTALLDVTEPEPMHPNSPLRHLPNVRVSGHIAGSINQEVQRMADSALAEFGRYARGEALHHQVTRPMLDTMA